MPSTKSLSREEARETMGVEGSKVGEWQGLLGGSRVTGLRLFRGSLEKKKVRPWGSKE